MTNRFTSSLDRVRNDESGAALPLIATMMILLIGVTAFAVDLGWIYLNSSRIQRAVDSAALAGVPYLPGDTANVNTFTVSGAEANGYDVGTLNGAPTGSGGPDNLAWAALADNRLNVTLDASIPTFFIKILGFDSIDISRTATAEYVKPVPLGSPDPCFGIGATSIEGQDCDPATAQNFWAAISGPYTNKRNGDEHATRWFKDSGSWSPPDTPNSVYRPEGYYLAVEIPAGVSDIDIDIYDAGFYDRGSFNVETGDREQDTDGGMHTHFEFYDFDATPLDPSDNTAIPGCRFDINTEASSGTYENNWVQLCTLTNPPPGIYVVRIWSTGNLGGTNQYSVRATTTGGGDARVYGINDISIFNNLSGLSTLYVAEVEEIHRGKILAVDLYDPGEDNQPAYMTVKTPSGATAQCDWQAYNEAGNPVSGLNGSGNCRIQTSDGSSLFNGYLVQIQIDLPTTYTCSSDCWWKMEIENSQPHDRTTWSAKVIGNPIKLTPNP